MSKAKEKAGFDLNLALMEDEALVVLAKECGYGPARDELIVRYNAQTDRLIGWMAYRYQFNNADAEDARQNAVFWIMEAVQKYDTNQIGKPRGCSFRSFIYRVIMARFKDFAKHEHRVECHYDRTASCGDREISEMDDSTLDDPASIAKAQESMNHLQQTLSNLDSESSRLWRMLADGKSLRQIASELDISYDAVKRRRRKLIDCIKIRLTLSTMPES